ncbi:MAG: AAA family ATPase [Rickettsiales bacterium]
MDSQSPILVVTPNEEDRQFANQLAASLGYPFANIVIGMPLDAAAQLGVTGFSPRYIVINIGARTHDVLPELDRLAEYCEAGTRVVIIGETNDIGFYRALMERGVTEYLNAPAMVDDVRRAIITKDAFEGVKGEVIAFIGGGAGDGSSTVALNTAYTLGAIHKQQTVLVDFDYQFGTVARQLDLITPYGMREIFEHPERGVDSTMLKRMVTTYKNSLDVISSPTSLHFLPAVPPEIVRDLINALQQKYRYVILDLPHLWTHWVSTALGSADHVVLVGQLWLKSVTHCSRLLNAWKDLGYMQKNTLLVINRSGSKFKDAIHPRDFERVCGHKIDIYLPNDIKTVVKAENQGVTTMELGPSLLATEIKKLTDMLHKSGKASNAAASGVRN